MPFRRQGGCSFCRKEADSTVGPGDLQPSSGSLNATPHRANEQPASAEGDHDANVVSPWPPISPKLWRPRCSSPIRRAAAFVSILFVQEGNDDVEGRPNVMPSSHHFASSSSAQAHVERHEGTGINVYTVGADRIPLLAYKRIPIECVAAHEFGREPRGQGHVQS